MPPVCVRRIVDRYDARNFQSEEIRNMGIRVWRHKTTAEWEVLVAALHRKIGQLQTEIKELQTGIEDRQMELREARNEAAKWKAMYEKKNKAMENAYLNCYHYDSK
ncbi:hypothetical protein COCC4DRAFT_18682 [Bipolaris maydis ATCC 48331]|uniref:Uncharacterized protein n=2 Tax=Cochliobolus heterostrophus TaxID=5016 RepID=M2UB37_COCH5|nr:uncharacterized protein COCC4DRAFT_18682 [Bipolaris maydis ATCC 48331]EMD95779.1 hypothetical protein COCHEDRAFT_1026604 [Bipolaris maydis C5]ENI10639.1 hypothetical protein COCC4DRAFT_18682 [Bipolaris maydis ATCC 48331]KAH7561690.1 hypothetical protein BM1_02794 [Bipolaris maydis]